MAKIYDFRQQYLYGNNNVYMETTMFLKEEIYRLTSQIRRASVSIPSNISEGYDRESKKEYIRFLTIAISSLFEVQTQL